MRFISRSAVLGAAALAALLTFGTMSSAQGPNKCLAGKNKCVSKKMQGLLKCHNKAEKVGAVLDPNCTAKVIAKFDGGVNPAKGCVAKLEAKNDGPCVTNGDEAALESKVDAFVLDVVQELDPGFPTPIQNSCSAGKKKCVLKKAGALLKCHEKAVKAGAPALADPVCLQKAKDKFDGGVNPAKGCFAKLEAKGGCLTLSDTAALEAKVDAFVSDVLCELGYTTLGCGPPPTPTPTITPTPTATPTCPPGPVFQGSLTQTDGSFNYNLTLGLPGANAACNTNFAGSHACTLFELQCAQAAGSLVGATDTAAMTVTSFWAIDPAANPLTAQCHDDVAFPCPGGICPPGHTWEYGTAHTPSRGQRVPLNNPLGTLGALQTGLQCNFSGNSWVGCCN